MEYRLRSGRELEAAADFQIMASLAFVYVTHDRTRQVATAGLIWLGLAVAGTFLFLFNPASPASQGIFPKCPFRLLTGCQCPGCGSTRAFHQLLHGHFVAAFELNPLMILTLPFLIYGLLGFTKSTITGQPQRRVFIPSFYLWSWLGLLIFFWVFRNTPWYPFVS